MVNPMPDKPKPVALAADAVIMGEPLPLDRSAISYRPGQRKPKRRLLVTQDGTTIAPAQPKRPIVHGEGYTIAGRSLALDARRKPSGQPVTFDGAMPSPKD